MQGNKDNNCLCTQKESLDFTELDKILDEYKNMQGNLIIILQKAQEVYGYLPKEIIKRISLATGYTEAKIFGVVTFYAQFRLEPIGKHLIMLCQGTACHVSGSKAIETAITDTLGIKDGETTADRMFTLNNMACLGCCSLAPVMMIQSEGGEETYGNLTEESVVEVLHNIMRKEGAL